MRTNAQPIGSSHGPWDLRAWLASLSVLLKRGKSDCPTAESEGRGHAKILPRITLRPIVIPPAVKRQPASGLINGNPVRLSTSGLWLALRTEVQGHVALWETASFLVIWLSGIIGVAMCLL